MLMELEHERRKERDRLQKDEALRARELDEHVRRVKEVKREKVHRKRERGGEREGERERARARIDQMCLSLSVLTDLQSSI